MEPRLQEAVVVRTCKEQLQAAKTAQTEAMCYQSEAASARQQQNLGTHTQILQ